MSNGQAVCGLEIECGCHRPWMNRVRGPQDREAHRPSIFPVPCVESNLWGRVLPPQPLCFHGGLKSPEEMKGSAHPALKILHVLRVKFSRCFWNARGQSVGNSLNLQK